MERFFKQFGIPAIFAAGVGWGVASYTLSQKLDSSTYNIDKVARSQVDSTVLRELRSLRSDVQVIRIYLCQGRQNDLGCVRQ